ncbi:MAG TPA: tRNA lysidine(34) synthetase TilS, partial [Gemmatimonadaceae bacterium]
MTSILRVVGDALAGRERVVLAVSGGLDSTVLLDAACRGLGGARLSVATFDHRTGAAATDAAQHVQRLCEQLGVDCDVGHADRALASEADFRDARWRFLRRIAAERGGVVVTAHTQDDQIETVLMRVMRDAGARGLAGLYATTDVVRPLVRTTRAELSAYAHARRLSWIEDPTNQSRRFLRNRVRHDLLPALRRARPSIDSDLLNVARQAAMWRAEVESLASTELDVRRHSGGLDVSASALSSRT